MAKKEGPAAAKWLKIDKAQQTTMLEVLGAAILVGVAIVLSIWLIKYITFNAKVIGEKDTAIKNYETSLRNLSTLESNVMAMADNKNLESVARDSLSECYDGETKINFYKEYQQATEDSDREQYLDMMRMCSALRVIPDALPSQENTEAALSSLNQLFLWAGATPSNLAPDNDNVSSIDDEDEETTGLQELPLRMSIEADDSAVFNSLSTIERSVREFDVTKLTFEWNSSGVLTVQGQLKAYYSGDLQARESTKTIKATEDKKK